MTPTDPVSSYADSPQRMLILGILFLFAVALLILSSRRWGAKPAHVAAPPSEKSSTVTPKLGLTANAG